MSRVWVKYNVPDGKLATFLNKTYLLCIKRETILNDNVRPRED